MYNKSPQLDFNLSNAFLIGCFTNKYVFNRASRTSFIHNIEESDFTEMIITIINDTESLVLELEYLKFLKNILQNS